VFLGPPSRPWRFLEEDVAFKVVAAHAELAGGFVDRERDPRDLARLQEDVQRETPRGRCATTEGRERPWSAGRSSLRPRRHEVRVA
jgi:hypothetical protein